MTRTSRPSIRPHSTATPTMPSRRRWRAWASGSRWRSLCTTSTTCRSPRSPRRSDAGEGRSSPCCRGAEPPSAPTTSFGRPSGIQGSIRRISMTQPGFDDTLARLFRSASSGAREDAVRNVLESTARVRRRTVRNVRVIVAIALAAALAAAVLAPGARARLSSGFGAAASDFVHGGGETPGPSIDAVPRPGWVDNLPGVRGNGPAPPNSHVLASSPGGEQLLRLPRRRRRVARLLPLRLVRRRVPAPVRPALARSPHAEEDRAARPQPKRGRRRRAVGRGRRRGQCGARAVQRRAENADASCAVRVRSDG